VSHLNRAKVHRFGSCGAEVWPEGNDVAGNAQSGKYEKVGVMEEIRNE
jgi:hypothetical protein